MSNQLARCHQIALEEEANALAKLNALGRTTYAANVANFEATR